MTGEVELQRSGMALLRLAELPERILCHVAALQRKQPVVLCFYQHAAALRLDASAPKPATEK